MNGGLWTLRSRRGRTPHQRDWLPATTQGTLGLYAAKLVLGDFGFDLQIGQFIAQALILDPQVLALLFSILHFLLQQDASLNGHVVFGFQVLQRRARTPGLTLVVIVYNLDIAQLQVQRPARLAQSCDLLLQGIMHRTRFSLGLPVLGLQREKETVLSD